ncbi:MAG: biopolymer transporter ExbD [Deltaproteobacteria bacterium HGW-Deltaproteobacteria-24]|jgi:biopolymer transport protein ExbD|nr:MAG: biopolymer transporter ExbD [Deltaproteobacteria bacterium HGW-Deltaproteobacteria-24]
MKRREKLSTDLTPLVDVIFILLIFFIVTSVFKKDELALILDLPSSNAKESQVEQKEITIELSETKIAYKGKEIELDDLNLALRLIRNRNDAIILRIDKNVKYERVVKLLDLLQAHNLNNLALVTNE